MRLVFLLSLIALLLFAAGCTSTQVPATVKTVTPTPTGSLPHPLAFNTPVPLVNGSSSFTASVTNIESAKKETDNYLVDIYINVRNTGEDTINLVWYSRLTDKNGKTYGGVGLSHAGTGAVSREIKPGYSTEARDFIRITSDADYAALADGATLDVTFIDRMEANRKQAVFHDTWQIPAGFFRNV